MTGAFRFSQAPCVEGGGLVALRTVFVGLLASLRLYVAAFSFIAPWDGGDEDLAPGVIVATGAVSLVEAWVLSRRDWSSESAAPLAGSYRTRMFLCIGIAGDHPLVAVASTFVFQDSLWLIVLGAAMGLIGLWMVAPARSNLARDEQRLRERGSALDILETLEAPSAMGDLRSG